MRFFMLKFTEFIFFTYMCVLCVIVLILTQVELNDGSWKEVERVERPLDLELLEQELHEKCMTIAQETNNIIQNGNTDIKEKVIIAFNNSVL